MIISCGTACEKEALIVHMLQAAHRERERKKERGRWREREGGREREGKREGRSHTCTLA